VVSLRATIAIAGTPSRSTQSYCCPNLRRLCSEQGLMSLNASVTAACRGQWTNEAAFLLVDLTLFLLKLTCQRLGPTKLPVE